MQGRLLPKYQGRYQAHPLDYWQDEFAIAKQLGLDCIEFILDYKDAASNPLLRPDGAGEISRISAATGVKVQTICADYFMEAPLHHADAAVAAQSREVLSQLLRNGLVLGISDIVIPCVDQSSFPDDAARDRFVVALGTLLPEAEAAGINLSLETDLAPAPFAALLNATSRRSSRTLGRCLVGPDAKAQVARAV